MIRNSLTDPSQAAPERMFSEGAAWQAVSALPGPYLPWSSGAMRPTGLVTVLNDIALADRHRVVELGSGSSTVLFARLLRQRSATGGIRLVAVEHDPAWARWVIRQLEREGLSEAAAVVHAPLAPGTAGELPWYDEDTLSAGLDAAYGSERIDLLLIDGPPAYAEGQQLARYPALPVLLPRLAPGATVVLDDVERPGEQEVLRRWETETGLRFERRAEDAGVAVGTLPAATGQSGG